VGLFFSRFSKPNTRATAVFIDELDAGGLQVRRIAIRAKRSISERQHTTNRRLHHHAAWRFALFFLGGNSSPFIGGLPTPARLRSFSAFGIAGYIRSRTSSPPPPFFATN
jgi:hypothetical protein